MLRPYATEGCLAEIGSRFGSVPLSEWPDTRSELQRGRCGRCMIRRLLAHVVFVEDVSPGMNRGLERPKRKLPPSGLEPRDVYRMGDLVRQVLCRDRA